MVIAVYANLKLYHPSNSQTIFIKNFIEHLIAAYPQHSFYLIGPTDGFINKPNLDIINLKPSLSLFSKYFLNEKIRAVLKSIKATALFSFDAIINTGISQSALISDKQQKFKKPNLEKLKTIFTLSEKNKTALIKQYHVAPKKIQALYGGPVKPFAPITDENKFAIKAKYADGKEYLLCREPIEEEQNIVALLKNFSVFKKRQKTSMKLIVMGELLSKKEQLVPLINTYKYRDDVVLLNNTEETEEILIIGAAFAFLQAYPANSLVFELEALQNGIPVLTDSTSPLLEIAPDAALYFDASNANDISDKLMLVYKDENLRNQLIKKGKDIANKYGWKQTIEVVWQSLQSEN